MKILVLENDDEFDRYSSIGAWTEWMKGQGHEVRCIFNAYNSGEEIMKEINWCDLLAFQSTFIYINAIFNLMMGIIETRKKPLEIRIDADNLGHEVERLMKLYSMVPCQDEKGEYWVDDEQREEDFAWKLKDIKIVKLSFDYYDNVEMLVDITVLNERIAARQAKIDEDAAFMATRPSAFTGRHIRIRSFAYLPGKEWSKLKKGMIVPEIDMSGSSDRIQKFKDRGVWVMGLTEPVKLLNDGGHDEYEIVCRNADDLAEELLKKCDAKLDSGNFFLVQGILKDDTISPHLKAICICDELGAPRRVNRDVIEERIEQFEKSNLQHA